MSDLMIFENETFGQVRTVLKKGEPWFVLKDVCEVFGETNYRRASGRLDEDEKGVSQIDTPGGKQSMTLINEPGLYSALFAMEPTKARGVTDEYVEKRLAQLKSFKRWITHEVIPSIRKTGAYYGKRAPGRPRISSTGAYVPKFWKGEQVVTIRDISTQTGTSWENIKRQIGHRVKELRSDEAVRLIGDELAEFIAENPAMPPAYRAFGLWIFNERGFNRIASWPRDVGKSSGLGWDWDAFTVSAQLPAPQLPATQPSVTQVTISRIAPDRPAEQPTSSLNVQELRKTLVALDVTLDIYEHAPTAQNEADGAAALTAIASHFLKLTAGG